MRDLPLCETQMKLLGIGFQYTDHPSSRLSAAGGDYIRKPSSADVYTFLIQNKNIFFVHRCSRNIIKPPLSYVIIQIEFRIVLFNNLIFLSLTQFLLLSIKSLKCKLLYDSSRKNIYIYIAERGKYFCVQNE